MLHRLKLYYAQNERRVAVSFFVAGFVFDIFTTGRIDSWLTIGQQLAYLAVVMLALTQMLLEQGEPPRDLAAMRALKRWYFEYRSAILHFLLGALLSLYAIFFFKSSSLFASFGFLAVLVTLLVANESERFRKLGLPFKFALLGLCWLSFFAYVIPILVGSIGTGVFLLSMLAGCVPLAKLEAETMALAKELAGKDAAALKATKDGYRFSLEMTWEASMNYTFAKENEIFVAQKGGWIDQGIGDFLHGKSKPGKG